MTDAPQGRLSDVAYVETMATLVVKFADGRVYAVALAELDGIDTTAVMRVGLASDGYAALIEQESGNRLEIPWDVILYHAEPRYRFYKHGSIEAENAGDRREIGERIRFERTRRHWTLADLSVRTGIKIPNLSRLENGRHTPSLPTLEKVADAFGLPVALLVSTARAVGVGS